MRHLKTGIYSGSLDCSLQNENLIACTTVYDGLAINEQIHCHENPHISFVLSGGNLEKRKAGEIERLPGKTTFYHSGEYHCSTKIANGSKHINLEVHQQYLSNYGFTEATVDFATNNNPASGFLMLQVLKEIQESDIYSAISIQMLLNDLLSQTGRLIEITKKHKWVIEIQELLRANWNQQLTLEEMALILKMHPVTLSRQFHNYFSCTIGEYMRKLKVEKALILIKSTGQPLTEIAYECGFADQSHFIRSFKQLTGFLPKTFRKM